MRSARAYVTSRGLYELEINGRRVGDQLFTPGWTSYGKRLQYQTYDVTALLKPGRQRDRRDARRRLVPRLSRVEGPAERLRRALGLLCQLRIEYADGRVETVGTDENWKATTGPSSRPTSTWARPTTRGSRSRAGARRASTTRAGRRCASPPRRRSTRSSRRGTAGARDRGGEAGEDPPHAGRRDRLRLRPEHGRPGAAEGERAGRHEGRPAPRRGARQGRQPLHGQPARGEAAGRVHAEGRRRRDLRAALHLPGLPLRRGRRLAGRAGARRPHRRRRALRHGRDRRVRDLEPAAQPAAAQHPLGPEGQLPRRADRLPAARRAARLDGRRAGVLAHGQLQHGRGGLLHEVAARTSPPTRTPRARCRTSSRTC